MTTSHKQQIAQAAITVAAPRERVWHALVTPAEITQYMFGADVSSEWTVGSEITWNGEWKGKPYQDRGRIVTFTPPEELAYTHYSPLSGAPDTPENYHTVRIMMHEVENGTRVELTQDGNATDDARQHSEENWNMMLEGLKKLLEKQPAHD
jgi:uncharacterized protein YndB with AHSA1/START domain